LKQKQSIVPSKGMALQQAEDFVIKAQSKIAKLKEQQGKGSVDE